MIMKTETRITTSIDPLRRYEQTRSLKHARPMPWMSSAVPPIGRDIR